MKDKVVAILETRTGAHLGELIARRGGIPLLAPALHEVPDIEPAAVRSLINTWRACAYSMVIFQTGVGTRALFDATDLQGLTSELLGLLEKTIVAVRGPKPTGELNSRHIRIDIRAAQPFTTETVLEAIAGVSLERRSVLVQRYGVSNEPLRQALEKRGASVAEIATYRWALPDDIRPLEALLDALGQGRVHAVVFTSAVQINNLMKVAERRDRAATLAQELNGLIVASIGPVCSRALKSFGIQPTFEASPPKLGPLLAALDGALH